MVSRSAWEKENKYRKLWYRCTWVGERIQNKYIITTNRNSVVRIVNISYLNDNVSHEHEESNRMVKGHLEVNNTLEKMQSWADSRNSCSKTNLGVIEVSPRNKFVQNKRPPLKDCVTEL